MLVNLLGGIIAYQDIKYREINLLLIIPFYFLTVDITFATFLILLSIILEKVDFPFILLYLTQRNIISVIWLVILFVWNIKKKEDKIPFVAYLVIGYLIGRLYANI